MITIMLNDGEQIKYHPTDYEVSTNNGWLYVKKNVNGIYRDLKRMIPVTSIKYISFD